MIFESRKASNSDVYGLHVYGWWVPLFHFSETFSGSPQGHTSQESQQSASCWFLWSG